MCLSGPEKMILKVRLMRGAARWRFIIPFFGNNLLFFLFLFVVVNVYLLSGAKGVHGEK